jgi:hypothetical protein
MAHGELSEPLRKNAEATFQTAMHRFVNLVVNAGAVDDMKMIPCLI